jgi:hypothetical protein
MIASTFLSITDTRPQRVESSWEDFAADFEFMVAQNKLDLPLWSPAEFKGNRSGANVERVHALVLDLDEVTEEQALAACASLERYRALVYTTWSHRPAENKFCLRVVADVSRPILPAEWTLFWRAASGITNLPVVDPKSGGGIDRSCQDISRAYFPCAGPPGAEDDHFQLVFSGEPLDVDSYIASAPTVTTAAPSPPADPGPLGKLSRESFEKFARGLARRKEPALADVGERLEKVARGESFADPGERDTTVFRMAAILAERFINFDPDSVAERFALSLDRMAGEPGSLTRADVSYKVRRAQEAIRADKEEKERGDLTAKQERIREAFRGVRTEPYKPEELAKRMRWVIQHGSSFYYWLDGGYSGPYPERSARAAAVRDLAPAQGVVDLFEVDRGGAIQLKSLERLVVEYGTVANQSIADFTAKKANYVETARTLVEAPCPMRDLPPVYDKAVDKYLQLLSGERYEELKTWVAALGRLDLPCAALFLVGPRGAGKSLFAHGHSRLWSTRGPSYLDEAMAPFNDALLRCPLCVADESLPRDMRGFARNAELRMFIQATSRPLNRKFMPVSTLVGATRTVVTANNEEVLATPENLSADDIGAIAQRYFFLRVPEECAQYLIEVNPRLRQWVSGDVIAKHARWLMENHKWEPKERFIIAARDEQITRSLTVRSGPRSALCKWLVSFLLEPRLYEQDNSSRGLVRVRDDQLLVNVRGIERCWSTYVQHEPCPPTGRLSSALAALSGDRIVRDGVAFRVIDMRMLAAWSEETGYADRERLRAALGRESPPPKQEKSATAGSN